jgi:hypothetical protein
MPFRTNLTQEDKDNIKTWLLEGLRYSEISEKLGKKVTRQRIHQLSHKYGIYAPGIRRERQQKELNDKMFAKWGAKWQDEEWRKSAVYHAMREKFINKKKNTHNCEFTVDFGDLTFPTYCPILDIKLDYFNDQIQDNSPSFDRIDPSKGYIKDNVAIISMRANRIKNNGSAEEHEKIAAFIRQHLLNYG